MKLLQIWSCLLMLVFAVTAHAGSVDINTADAAALDAALVNIGPAKAAAIVEYRQAHGPFRRVQDLLEVKGIGEKTLQKNLANITLGAGNSPARAVASSAAPARNAAASRPSPSMAASPSQRPMAANRSPRRRPPPAWDAGLEE